MHAFCAMLWLMLVPALALAVEIVAHRGASADAPENTLAAYRLAWEQNADAIECDLRLTRDGRIVCLHDATTDRTTGVKGKLADLTLEEARRLDAGSWKDPRYRGEKLPTLAEILALVPPDRRILIEMKVGPEIVPLVQRDIQACGLRPEQITLISFDEKVVAACRRAMPNIKANFLYAFRLKDGVWSSTHEELIERMKRMNATGLGVSLTEESLPIVNEELARGLRQANIELHVWTIDDPGLARRAVQLGALSITTNRPGALRAELAR